MVGAVAKQVNVCTKCLKRVRKDIVDKKVPFFKIVGSTDLKKEAAVASK